MHPFGARVKVLTNLPAQLSLTDRTSGETRTDPSAFDANAITIVDANQPSSFTGRYLGNSNHPGVILVYKEGTNNESNRIARVHHTVVDYYGLSSSQADSPLPHEKLLRVFH